MIEFEGGHFERDMILRPNFIHASRARRLFQYFPNLFFGSAFA